MPTLIYSFLLAVVSIFSYVWVVTPSLSDYTLQLFAFGVFLFLVLKRFRKTRTVVTDEKTVVYELAVLLGCILIFIGTNQSHPGLLYPIVSVALFFFVFFSSTFLSLLTACLMTIFLLLTQTYLKLSDYSIVLMIPLLFALFLFTKKQYDLAQKEKNIIAQDEIKIETVQKHANELEIFISEYLKPKLEILHELAEEPAENCDVIKSQLALLDSEMEKQLTRLR